MGDITKPDAKKNAPAPTANAPIHIPDEGAVVNEDHKVTTRGSTTTTKTVTKKHNEVNDPQTGELVVRDTTITVKKVERKTAKGTLAVETTTSESWVKYDLGTLHFIESEKTTTGSRPKTAPEGEQHVAGRPGEGSVAAQVTQPSSQPQTGFTPGLLSQCDPLPRQEPRSREIQGHSTVNVQPPGGTCEPPTQPSAPEAISPSGSALGFVPDERSLSGSTSACQTLSKSTNLFQPSEPVTEQGPRVESAGYQTLSQSTQLFRATEPVTAHTPGSVTEGPGAVGPYCPGPHAPGRSPEPEPGPVFEKRPQNKSGETEPRQPVPSGLGTEDSTKTQCTVVLEQRPQTPDPSPRSASQNLGRSGLEESDNGGPGEGPPSQRFAQPGAEPGQPGELGILIICQTPIHEEGHQQDLRTGSPARSQSPSQTGQPEREQPGANSGPGSTSGDKRGQCRPIKPKPPPEQ